MVSKIHAKSNDIRVILIEIYISHPKRIVEFIKKNLYKIEDDEATALISFLKITDK